MPSPAVTELKADRRRPNRAGKPTERRAKSETREPIQERRVSVERRRQIDPTTCERDYRPDEVEFMKAIDDYKRRSGRAFPTWSEVLEVLRDLGYRKVAAPEQTYSAVEQG